MTIRLPQKDSAAWRGLITALQAFAGLIVAANTSPEIMAFLTEYVPSAVPTITAAAGIVALITNVLRGDVKNY